jgi:hypothetical protein
MAEEWQANSQAPMQDKLQKTQSLLRFPLEVAKGGMTVFGTQRGDSGHVQ